MIIASQFAVHMPPCRLPCREDLERVRLLALWIGWRFACVLRFSPADPPRGALGPLRPANAVPAESATDVLTRRKPGRTRGYDERKLGKSRDRRAGPAPVRCGPRCAVGSGAAGPGSNPPTHAPPTPTLEALSLDSHPTRPRETEKVLKRAMSVYGMPRELAMAHVTCRCRRCVYEYRY
jgi:hypothetical protein